MQVHTIVLISYYDSEAISDQYFVWNINCYSNSCNIKKHVFIQFQHEFRKKIEFICKKLSLVLSLHCLLLDRIAFPLLGVFFHFWADKNSSFHFIWCGQWNKVNEMHKIKKGMLKIMNKSHILYVHPSKYNANEIDFSPLDSFFFSLEQNFGFYTCVKRKIINYQHEGNLLTISQKPTKAWKSKKKKFKTPEKESKHNWKPKKNIEPIVYHFLSLLKCMGF